MSSYLFEREQIHCNCFDTSPKNTRGIFRTEKQQFSKSNSKQVKQPCTRNNSQQGKQKKKSLKKERHLSKVGSEKDPKQKEEPNPSLLIPDVQSGFSSFQVKREPKTTVLQYFQQPAPTQVKTERTRITHSFRTHQRPQHFYEPIIFEERPQQHIKAQYNKIQFQNKVINDIQYDRIVTQEFEKDLEEFKLQMDMIDDRSLKGSVKHKTQKIASSLDKIHIEKVQKTHSAQTPPYPTTEHVIPLFQNLKLQHPVVSFRNSRASKRQNTQAVKIKQKMLPRQIQSQKGSNSDCSSDNQSVFLGRGFDGLTEKHWSLQEVEKEASKERGNLETTVTQQSQIKNSQVQTLTEFSHIITSPKSLIGKGIAFGGGSKYGAAGMSFQQKVDVKRSHKLQSMTKLNF